MACTRVLGGTLRSSEHCWMCEGVCGYHNVAMKKFGCTVHRADGYHSRSITDCLNNEARQRGDSISAYMYKHYTSGVCHAGRASNRHATRGKLGCPQDINRKAKATSTDPLVTSPYNQASSQATSPPTLPTSEVSKRSRKYTVHTKPTDSARTAKASGSE